MVFTSEQISQLKSQLREQIKNLPEEQKREAESQIKEMSDEAIEAMLEQQKKSQKPIFRAIISNEIPSRKIDENKMALAVLDIKPITRGHTVIIPKSPVKNGKDIPTQAFTIAKKIGKKMTEKLKAKSIEIQTEFKFGEIIINVIPLYDKPISMSSPRNDAPEKELEEIENILKIKPKAKRVLKQKKEKPNSSNLHQIKRRVP